VPYHYVQDPENPSCWAVSHERSDYTFTFHGSEEAVERTVSRMELDDEQARRACLSADPLDLCWVRWHRTRLSDGTLFYFRVVGGVVGRHLRFLWGPQPFRYACTWIQGMGINAVPWRCVVCGSEIGWEFAPPGAGDRT
jgi:hypothetical protein